MNLFFKKCLAGQCQKNLLSILRAGLQQSIGMLHEAEDTNFYISPWINTVCEFETHLTGCLEKCTLKEAYVLVVDFGNGVLGALEYFHFV